MFEEKTLFLLFFFKFLRQTAPIILVSHATMASIMKRKTKTAKKEKPFHCCQQTCLGLFINTQA
jgi:hypothetical protein